MSRGVGAALVYHDGEFVRDHTVLIDDGRITAVAPDADAPNDIDDWGEVALIPAPVNAHGHAWQSLLKGFADDRTFDEWRDKVLYPFSERLDATAIYTGSLFAFAEALLAGTATTVDFFYLHDGDNANAEQVIRAAADIGVRLVFARAFYDIDAPTSAPPRCRESASSASERCLELARAHDGESFVSVQPAPHSLHAASPETIAAALHVARDLEVPCHLHLAEASYEREMIENRYGTTPVRLLEREGLLDPRLLTIHTVWVDDEELDMLAEADVSVVHCPGANAFLGDGMARVPEILSRGIRVALGPDGGCANNRQSVFDEMRTASLIAKARLADGSALDAPTAFALGTSAGGQVLGIPTGAIAPGCYADLVALDLSDLSLQPQAILDRNVVNSMQQTAISKVMVGGEVVVDGGRLVRMDEREIAARVAEVTSGWTRP